MDGEFVEEDQSIYGSNSSRIVKMAAPKDSVLMRFLRSGAGAGDGYTTPASDGSKYRSLLTHYQHSNGDVLGGFSSRGSPLSPAENLELTTTPAVKVEEDVLVMDGIMVNSLAGLKVMRSASSDSSGSSSSAASGNGLYKTEICRSWEDLSNCRYGTKCQFAHGKEELRPIRYPMRNRSEGNICKQFAVTGACPYGPRCRFSHQLQPVPPSTHQTPSPPRPPHIATKTTTPLPTKTSAAADWSPMDDGIEVRLPDSSTDQSPSREEVNAYINSFLYSPTKPRRRRLPVLEELCPCTD